MTRQLALPFLQTSHYDPAGFLAGEANEAALAWLENPAAWPGARLAVHGAAGSGKTHFLHVFAHRHGASLIPGEAVRHWLDLPDAAGLAVDDADLAPEPESLLHLLNQAAERRIPVLLAGRLPPARWAVTLPDLASRLRAITAVGLGQPDDALLRALFAQLIAARQLRVESEVQAYLLARLPRSPGALREAAALLDRLSLAAGGRVTRAIAMEVIERQDVLF